MPSGRGGEESHAGYPQGELYPASSILTSSGGMSVVGARGEDETRASAILVDTQEWLNHGVANGDTTVMSDACHVTSNKSPVTGIENASTLKRIHTEGAKAVDSLSILDHKITTAFNTMHNTIPSSTNFDEAFDHLFEDQGQFEMSLYSGIFPFDNISFLQDDDLSFLTSQW